MGGREGKKRTKERRFASSVKRGSWQMSNRMEESFGSSWNEVKYEYNFNAGCEAGQTPSSSGWPDPGNETCIFYLRPVTTFSVKNLL